MSAGFTAGQAEPFFALKYQRLLFHSGDAAAMGPTAFALCCVVATHMDMRRFQTPCTFFNRYLTESLGLKKVDTLVLARTKAIELGWLGYESKKKTREAGQYWIVLPEHVLGELDPKNGCSNGSSHGVCDGGSDRSSTGGSNGSCDGSPITLDPMPNPDPTPKPKRSPFKVSIDDLPLPPQLTNHECKSAMDRFFVHKRQVGSWYKAMNGVTALLNKIADWSKEEFLEAVNDAVASGKWATLYRPRPKTKTNGYHSRMNFDDEESPTQRLLTPEEEAECTRIGFDAFAKKMGWA